MSVPDPQAPEIPASENSPCPTCGSILPDLVEGSHMSSAVWLFNGRFYCGEQCAYIASTKVGTVRIQRELPR